MTRLLALFLAAAMLASCGGGESPDKPSGLASASPSTTPSSGVPRPTQEQQAELIAALRRIDARLVQKADRAASRSRETCRDVLTSPAVAARNTELRFEGPSLPSLTSAQVQAIIAAVKITFCHA